MSRTAGRTRLPPLVWMYLPMVGMSWTCDCTCRANSRSTFSRSSRIGSKICASASINLRTLSRPEEAVEVRGRPVAHILGGHAVHVGQRAGDLRDVRRLVARAAMRRRRQKRAVGLDERAIQRDASRRLPQLRRLRKCDDARPGNVEPEIEPGARQRRSAREAMQDAAQCPAALLAKETNRILVRFPRVDHDWKIELPRERELRTKDLLLDGA